MKAGQPILELDLEFLNANARSMISPVVCSNSDDYSALVIQATGKVVAGTRRRCTKLKANKTPEWRLCLSGAAKPAPLFLPQTPP